MDEAMMMVSTGCGETGKNFVDVLLKKGFAVVVLVHSEEEGKQLQSLGAVTVRYIQEMTDRNQLPPEFVVKNAFVFENNLPQCCQDIELCHSFCPQQLYVVSSNKAHVGLVYKNLGATYVIHSRNGNVSFLL
ncbi:NmrA family NAD(P)-binding protein [Paenibacillus pabuli]|uniref:NmrA family NAD(P)-binding protein n=1 Tax=Paenibacillus pabuli TaxID=1472 RepID=UPI000A6E8297|nr:NmrA family NAD(P)-binding protein [Paenibacillus pabuli]MEC0124897.1 NmrA family NAD(P)-binding protein [Paenibacillus pabuli]